MGILLSTEPVDCLSLISRENYSRLIDLLGKKIFREHLELLYEGFRKGTFPASALAFLKPANDTLHEKLLKLKKAEYSREDLDIPILRLLGEHMNQFFSHFDPSD